MDFKHIRYFRLGHMPSCNVPFKYPGALRHQYGAVDAGRAAADDRDALRGVHAVEWHHIQF
eukprot:scaffold200117_cov32-Prasinocladus_malaysianus.AAC.2